MSSRVWKFENRIEELIEKLGDVIQCSSTSQIKMEWSYRAELCMEPAGWDALWRIPKYLCHSFGVRYPCVVYVSVESLNLECCENSEDSEICAAVEVMGVQDDYIHLPAKHSAVPIIQLWPLKSQPNAAIDVKSTAEFIDLYRYFYTYIWMPWDIDWEVACGSWFDSNVPARINMWHNAGVDVHELRSIRDEAKKLAIKITQFQSELPSDVEEDDLDLTGEAVSELMMLHDRMQQLKQRWQTYQNPTIKKLEPISDLPPQNISIWTGGSVDSHISFLRNVNKWLLNVSNDNTITPLVQCSPSLEATLASAPPTGSKIFLCSGEHVIPTNNLLGKNYSIKSVSSDTKLVCKDERTTALAIVGSLKLEDIRILGNECSTVLSVRAGNVEVDGCKFEAATNVTSQAMIIFAGAQVKISRSHFGGFFTGIMAQKGSMVQLEECTFLGCGVGIQICDGAKVTMSRCSFAKCVEAGVRYESQTIQSSVGGNLSLLKKFDNEISCMECSFVDNDMHDVFIVKQDENAKPEWEDPTVSP